jgi:hypothetical protein
MRDSKGGTAMGKSRRGWVLAVVIAAVGCGDDEPAHAPDGGAVSDAGSGGRAGAAAKAGTGGGAGTGGTGGTASKAGAGGRASEDCAGAVAAVTTSLERWDELGSDDGGIYWYDEEYCAPNMPNGTVTTVQVGPSGPMPVRTRNIERKDCEAQVNRYELLEPSTFEQLYAMCKTLVMRECDTTFTTDDRGVVRSCMWDKDQNCSDNCGQGFHLRAWGFGDAPAQ